MAYGMYKKINNKTATKTQENQFMIDLDLINPQIGRGNVIK